jgi:hypothetical protein
VDLFQKGAYGDKKLEEYIEIFLGDTWNTILETSESRTEAIKTAVGQINSYGDNLYGIW